MSSVDIAAEIQMVMVLRTDPAEGILQSGNAGRGNGEIGPAVFEFEGRYISEVQPASYSHLAPVLLCG